MKFCPECGTARADGDNFCQNCGNAFASMAMSQDPATHIQHAPMSAPQAPAPMPEPALSHTPPTASDAGNYALSAGEPIGGIGFSNNFGEVHNDRITFYVKKNFFAGRVREDYPIRHITSIRAETTRSVGAGIVMMLIGLVLFAVGGAAVVLGFIFIAIGVLLLIGAPSVAITTAGGERQLSIGAPLQFAAADEFARAVRERLFAIS